MNNLVIGNTSQLAYYFPIEYEKIPSRCIDFEYYKDKFYDRIFLCFGENRTFLDDDENAFMNTNVFYTTELIKFFIDHCNKLVVYGTSELWNNCEGPIDISTPSNFNTSFYIRSKGIMTLGIHDLRFNDSKYKNVIILHPFNFNSIYRTYEKIDDEFHIRKYIDFLFGKVFYSILNEKLITIGDTYFYRDLIHPKYVVQRSLLAESDEIVGSGRLTFVNDFIKTLYEKNNLKYEDFVTENNNSHLGVKRKIFYVKSLKPLYSNLLEDTLNDINKFKL